MQAGNIVIADTAAVKCIGLKIQEIVAIKTGEAVAAAHPEYTPCFPGKTFHHAAIGIRTVIRRVPKKNVLPVLRPAL